MWEISDSRVWTEIRKDNELIKKIPVAVRSTVKVCGSFIVGIVGSSPAESMDIRLLCLLCVV